MYLNVSISALENSVLTDKKTPQYTISIVCDNCFIIFIPLFTKMSLCILLEKLS